jgi:hypothetical protein
MNESIIINNPLRQQFSAQATLVGIGVKVCNLQVLKPIEQELKIHQKTVKDTPYQKLIDGLIAILCGAHGLVEINKRIRPDQAVQMAFGRERCAEQSVVQETLDACTHDNVAQMQKAMSTIFRQQSQAYRHNYRQDWQILDVDLTGRPCGKKAAFATKGYFTYVRNRRGRQVGYLTASAYREIVVEQVYEGTTHLTQAFQELCQAAEEVLELDNERRGRTIIRVDAGGGSIADVNWALKRGYHFHGKDYAPDRVKAEVGKATNWIVDPRESGRQVAWVNEVDERYERPLRRIAVRCQKKNGQWGIGVILSSLSPEDVLMLTGQSPALKEDPQAVLLAYVYFYDQRGGWVEIDIKGDKQGLGTTHRNKKRFPGQQMVCQLEALAHNLLIWVRRWLAPQCPKLARWGLLRLVRDALHINGLVKISPSGIFQIVLNQADPLAQEVQAGLAALLAVEHIDVILGKI